jgi:hypothetical protein
LPFRKQDVEKEKPLKALKGFRGDNRLTPHKSHDTIARVVYRQGFPKPKELGKMLSGKTAKRGQ